MKKRTSKLALHRDTLRILDGHGLSAAHGAIGMYTAGCPSGPILCNTKLPWCIPSGEPFPSRCDWCVGDA